MSFHQSVKSICPFCGESSKGSYCAQCKTKEQRAVMIKEQLKIDSENERFGYKIAPNIFGKNRETLMKEYGIK